MLFRRILSLMICVALAMGGLLPPAVASAGAGSVMLESMATSGDCGQPELKVPADCDDCAGGAQESGFACDGCSGSHHCSANVVPAVGLDHDVPAGGAYNDPLQVEAWALPMSFSGPPRA